MGDAEVAQAISRRRSPWPAHPPSPGKRAPAVATAHAESGPVLQLLGDPGGQNRWVTPWHGQRDRPALGDPRRPNGSRCLARSGPLHVTAQQLRLLMLRAWGAGPILTTAAGAFEDIQQILISRSGVFWRYCSVKWLQVVRGCKQVENRFRAVFTGNTVFFFFNVSYFLEKFYCSLASIQKTAKSLYINVFYISYIKQKKSREKFFST